MKKTLAGVPVQDMPEDAEMVSATLDAHGHEVLDPTPIAPPVGFQDPPSIEDLIKTLVSSGVRAALEAEGYETEEEANDFDVGEDLDPYSPHEFSEEEEALVRQTLDDYRARKERPPAGPPATPSASVAPVPEAPAGVPKTPE